MHGAAERIATHRALLGLLAGIAQLPSFTLQPKLDGRRGKAMRGEPRGQIASQTLRVVERPAAIALVNRVVPAIILEQARQAEV